MGELLKLISSLFILSSCVVATLTNALNLPKFQENGDPERPTRLQKAGYTTLYHQTSVNFGKSIQLQGFKCANNNGNVGPAVYFAEDPKHTNSKAVNLGYMIEAKVWLGKVCSSYDRQGDKAQSRCNGVKFGLWNYFGMKNQDDNKATKHTLLKAGYDSMTYKFRNWFENNPEYAVFFTDQIPLENITGYPWNSETNEADMRRLASSDLNSFDATIRNITYCNYPNHVGMMKTGSLWFTVVVVMCCLSFLMCLCYCGTQKCCKKDTNNSIEWQRNELKTAAQRDAEQVSTNPESG